MPLRKDASEESFHANVAELISAGHPKDQALAIAYKTRRDAGWKDGDEHEGREIQKGGANVHVKAHYRLVNGKLIYVHEHDKAGQIGTEAQLHERVQFGKNKSHLMAIDPEDRDAALKHAGQLGLKPEVKYQGGKIKNEAGESKAHGFHYLKFNNEEEAKKVHASIAAASKGEGAKPEGEPAEAASDGNDGGVKEYPGTGKQAGVTVRVAKRKDGKFAVTMKDDDSGEVFPQAMVFPTEEWAHTYAQEIAAGKKPSGNPAAMAKVEPTSEGESVTKDKPAVDTEAAKSAFMKVDPANILVDKNGKQWTRGAYSSSGTDLHPFGGGESQEFTWDQIAGMGLKDTGKLDPEQDEDNTEQPTGATEPKAEPASQLKDLLNHAEGVLHKDPKAAIAALNQAAALAEEHGIDYTHGNGKKVDAAWMKKMAGQLEAALPKTPAVDEEYAQAAKQATEASGSAHEHTKKMAEAQKMGAYDAPDSHAGASSAHTEGDKLHGKAISAHEKAAEKAPTPELKEFHQQKAKEHAAKGLVHQEAAKKHLSEHKKNQAQDVYDYEVGKAEAASMGANQAKTNHSITDSHEMAADAHTDAAKQHTAMIQHALANRDQDAATKHAATATEHQKKAAFHTAAKAAWKSTVDAEAGHIGHIKASALHSAAAQEAEDAGMKDAAEYHDKQAKEHLDKHKAAKAQEPVHPNTKAADEASDEGKAQPSPSNQWKGKDSTQIVNLGHKAFNEGDYAEAIKHYKHAAVVAHHNGHTGDAANYVKHVQEAMDMMKQVQKALPSMHVSVQEAARQLHSQRNEPRNFAKAIKDLPAAGKLQKACADATKAGITDVHHIVEMAVGGKKSAAPYLAFLAGVNQ